MAKEDAYHASTASLSMYGGLFKAIADDVGLDKALEHHAKQGIPFGTMIGETMKKHLGDKAPTPEALKSVLQPMMDNFGFNAEYNVSPSELSMKVSECPVYNGFKMAGLDHETISKTCRAMSNAEYNQIKNYYPNIEGSVKFRDSLEGYCLEKFTIT